MYELNETEIDSVFGAGPAQDLVNQTAYATGTGLRYGTAGSVSFWIAFGIGWDIYANA